ncbi:hypothetical protein [Nonomuraea typhae]|uniref:MFS transporter n=1 Tax=Nonomuraea typhae TaxID=2603600 RepID=A0ABW7Z3M5_9ACTN
MHLGQPLPRAARATVFSVACVLSSLAMHVLAGGAPVRPVTLYGAIAAAWAGAFLLGRRQRGVNVLLPACFAAQYGMHHLFTWGAIPAPGQHGHGAGMGAGLGMLLVHAMVAVISAWWLERGESSLATVVLLLAASLGRLWTALRLLVRLPVTIQYGSRRPAWPERDTPRDRLLRAARHTRRGPPAFSSVL